MNMKIGTEEMAENLRKGVANKKNAVEDLNVPEIMRAQIRKETLLGVR